MRTPSTRREFTWLVGLSLLVLLTTAGTSRKAAQLNNQANELYDAKKYEEANALYGDAVSRAPDAPTLYYNQGNALFRQGKLEEAAKLLQRGAESPDPGVREKSLYNLGNALYGTQKLPEAVAAYRQALLLDPHDRDAKINYEKALDEMQQQKQQQQQPGQQGKQGKQQKDQQGQGQNQQQDQQQGQEQSKDQQPKPDQAQQRQEQQNESQQEQQQQQQQQQPPPQPASLDSVPAGQLSKEEALRILEAMRQQEKELQAEKARARVRTRRVDKDW